MSDDFDIESFPDEFTIVQVGDEFSVEVWPDEFIIIENSDDWVIYTTTETEYTIEFQTVGLNDAAISIAARDAAIAAQIAAQNAYNQSLALLAAFAGGTTGYILIKNSNADYDFAWMLPTGMLTAIYDPFGIAANVYDRANHTGTQLASTISNFTTAADVRVAVAIGVTVQAYSAILAATTASYTVALNAKLGGIASGADVTVGALPVAIHGAVSKATPVDADELGLSDSAAAFGLKKLTWANVKAGILAYFNGTAKATPIDADRVWQGDSTTANTPVYSTWTQVKAFLKAYFDPLYVAVATYTAADVLNKIKTVDGTGSGLDADLLDGLNSAATATANTVAVRDVSGDIVTRLLRSEWASAGWTGGYMLVQNAIGSGVDNYARPVDIATVRATLGILFRQMYESPQQTITTGGTLTLAHGLGVKPKLFAAYLQCTTAEGGYAIGDEQGISPAVQALVPDATNMVIRFSNNAYALTRKDTGASFSITSANWRFVVRAWAP